MFRHALSAFCGGRLNACGRQPSARVRDVAPRAWPALAFAAVALLAGSSAAGFAADNVAAVPPHPGGTLNFGIATDTAIIDPSITGSSITALITRSVVDSLIGQAEDNHFTPWLAERWEVSPDNTRYTFTYARA
jgi:peptide/nickel transport system substrate-binding protein